MKKHANKDMGPAEVEVAPTTTLLSTPDDAAELSRRDFLRSGIGLMAFLSLPKLIVPQTVFAQNGEMFSLNQEFYLDGPTGTQRNLVWINMSGGWDILDTVDPHTPNSNITYSGGVDGLALGSDFGGGIKVGRWMSSLAALGRSGDALLIRGLNMGTTSHDAGSTYMDTGVLSNTGRVNAASIPAIVAAESQATIPIIQLAGGMAPRLDRGLKPVSLVRAENLELYRSMYPSDEAKKAQKLKMMDYLKESVNRVAGNVRGGQAADFVSDRLKAISSAEDKVRSQLANDVGKQLTLSEADRTPFSDAAKAANATGGSGRGAEAFTLALKLIKGDLANVINMGVGGFDTHSGQDASLQPLLTEFDRNLGVFVSELKKAGKLDKTLIILYSDFGRTPRINGGNGRDHWPVGGAVMIGGGIAGGRAVGSTNDKLLAVPVTQDANGSPNPSDTSTDNFLSPIHLGGAAVELCLGSAYLTNRSYLKSHPAMVRLKG